MCSVCHAQAELSAERLSSPTLESLVLGTCQGEVSFGALPMLTRMELTGRTLSVPDSISELSALRKLVRAQPSGPAGRLCIRLVRGLPKSSPPSFIPL